MEPFQPLLQNLFIQKKNNLKRLKERYKTGKMISHMDLVYLIKIINSLGEQH